MKAKLLLLGVVLTLVPAAASAYESQPSNTVGFMRFTTSTTVATKANTSVESKKVAETRSEAPQQRASSKK